VQLTAAKNRVVSCSDLARKYDSGGIATFMRIEVRGLVLPCRPSNVVPFRLCADVSLPAEDSPHRKKQIRVAWQSWPDTWPAWPSRAETVSRCPERRPQTSAVVHVALRDLSQVSRGGWRVCGQWLHFGPAQLL